MKQEQQWTTERITETVRQTLLDITLLPREELSDDAHFLHDLNLDSVSVIELVVDLEHAFGLRISDEEAEELFTIQEVAAYVEKALG